MTEPARNVELKAHDEDPGRTLERALAAGAQDRGVLRQRDTYFAVPRGRLKLREEEPGGATLIAYERPDAASERVSHYRLVPVADAAPLRAALAASAGVRVVVEKRRRLLLWEGVRIHLDAVEGLGAFLELEPDPALLALAREAAGRAYAPYSRFPVGAALRTADGRRYAGANVENAAYPQGQCAEASAIGALVAGGGGRIAEVVVAAPSRDLCTPCGGGRPRPRGV